VRVASRLGVAVTVVALVTMMCLLSAAGAVPSQHHHHRRHHHHHQGGGSGLTVTEADAGTTVSLPVGQTLNVSLSGTPGFRFSAPMSSDPMKERSAAPA